MSEKERAPRDPWQRCPYCKPPKLYSVNELAKMLVCGDLENHCFKCVRCRRLIEVGPRLTLVKPNQPPKKSPSGRYAAVPDFSGHDTVDEAPGKTQIPGGPPDEPEASDTIQVPPGAAVEMRTFLDRTIAKIETAVKDQIILDNQFKLLEIIGRGTTGIVVMARNLKIKSANHFVAVKFNLDTAVPGEDGEIPRGRVRRISGIQGRFKSPHVAKPIKLLEHPVFGLVTVESFVSGDNLREVVENDGSIKEEAVIAIGRQICSILIEAGQRGEIIHRDIKLDNIILEERDKVFVWLIDFGLARSNKEDARDNRAMFDTEIEDLDVDKATGTLTLAGAVLGTPAYMAPEQASGKRADCRTDIYGLAATLFHAITSRPPFTGAKLSDILIAVEHKEPQPAADLVKGSGIYVSASFSNVLMIAMQKNPDDRFQTPEEFDRALAACQRGEVFVLRKLNNRLTLVKQSKWRRTVLPWILLLGIGFVTLLVLFLVERTRITSMHLFK